MHTNMKITLKHSRVERISLKDFEAWGGGKEVLDTILAHEENEIMLALLTDIINDFNSVDSTVTPEQVNDFLWYDSELTIKDYLDIEL